MQGYYYRHHKSHLTTGMFALGLGALLGYLFAPKSGKENRDQIKNWMSNITEEIQERLNRAKEMSSERYNNLVDSVAYKYRKMQGIKQDELDDFVSDLKMRWDRIKDRWNNPGNPEQDWRFE